AIVCAQWVAESVAGAPRGVSKPIATAALPPSSDPSAVRPLLSNALGVLRDRSAIAAAVRSLLPLADGAGAAADPALVGLMIAVAAHASEESRGAHFRNDFPDALPVAQPSRLTLSQATAAARHIAGTAQPSLRSALP
ncbi:MAG: L-aspartate oxidase, partial [Bradyrhizobium sp.]